MPIHKRDSFEEIQKAAMVRDAIPQKVVGWHLCSNDESMTALITAQKLHFMTGNHRSRLRDHIGSHDEICFELETYGIHIDKTICLPNGRLGLDWYNEWIKCRESIEQEIAKADADAEVDAEQGKAVSSGDESDNNAAVVMIIPRKFDVLFGRGRHTREHSGNLRCAYLVEAHQEEYEIASKIEKTSLSEKIMSKIFQANGRFLKKDKTVS